MSDIVIATKRNIFLVSVQYKRIADVWAIIVRVPNKDSKFYASYYNNRGII